MADLFSPCPDYRPDSSLPIEACCTTCTHLDDEYPCAEMCRRFRIFERKEAIPSASLESTDACGGSGGEGGSKS